MVSYVKKGKWKKFTEVCEKNSLDFYSCGCILTAHLVMEKLMEHKERGPLKSKKSTPKEAWEYAMKQTPYHSGMSAAMTAIIIVEYSPRGEEFKEWCIKDDVVVVNWKGDKV